MKKILILTVFLTIFAVSYAFSVTLVDVPSGHWAEDAVQKLVDSGLIEGYPDGTYKGDRPLTRYEYAMVVSRMMDKMEEELCAKGDPDCAGGGVDEEALDELKGIVEKLAAEFEDEIEALKVKVDENATKIAGIEDKLATSVFNIDVSGNIRQLLEVSDSDLSADNLAYSFLGQHYDPLQVGTPGQTLAAANYQLDTGYQMRPYLQLDGGAGEDVTFSIGLMKYYSNLSPIGPANGANNDDLEVEHAYVDLDFSADVKELDLLTIRSGYQTIDYGPYGFLIDTIGNSSMPGISLELGKDRVTLSSAGMLFSANNTATPNTVNVGGFGMGSTDKDLYYAARLGIDLDEVRLGVNMLGNGVLQEKGWGVDVDADILTHSSFLTGIRAEYLTITDTVAGVAPTANSDDYSYVVGVDMYETKRSLVTLSYADLPAAPTMTGMDANPFVEYDSLCSLGLDIAGNGGRCYNHGGGNLLPMGFKGLGLQAHHIVLGDVKLAVKAVAGDYAGGSLDPADVYFDTSITDLEGLDYPGFGAFSITKPINDQSTFTVEYMQQGLDPILLNRIRSMLLIKF